MFWYTFLSFIIGASLASLALSGTQRLAVISFIPTGLTSNFADPLPRLVVKNAWPGWIIMIAYAIAVIITLKQTPHDPKLDFHFPVFGTYSLTGVAISALYNYIIMMTKLFVVSVWNPKNFVTLKVPLQSVKMMENRANMILVTAEKEKLYKKIGEDGQKLITAIVGSPSDVPWEFLGKTSKSMLFSRFRMDEKHQVTSDMECKLEFYVKKSLEQAYRGLHNFEDYKVIYEEISNKANVSPALPSMRISYRRLKLPYPGVSDRLLCMKSQYRYYPEHGFAFVVTQDAEKKYVDQIPKEVTKGTVRMTVRLAGYVLEKVNSRRMMTKVTYFVSSDIGGRIPVRIRNLAVRRETKRVEKRWDDSKRNGEGPALFSTEEVIENLLDDREGSRFLNSISNYAQRKL
eukprot:g3002.t1